MRMPFMVRGRREYVVRPLKLEDGGALAVLHADAFAKPWTDGEFEALLSQEAVFGYAAVETGRPGGTPVGFVLARLAAGEAEILTVAVARVHRRLGIGRQLMDAVLRELHSARAEVLFLEVEEANAAALALYRRLGFYQVASRPHYYRNPESRRSNALVMRRDLHARRTAEGEGEGGT